MKAYRIKDGKTLFETSETNKLKNLSWIPLPNRHDGKGYRRLLRLQDGPLLYAAWIGMLTVASKCKPRWILADADGPLTPEDLSVKTDIPAAAYEAAFKALITREIGWLDQIEVEGVPLESQENPMESAVTPARKKERRERRERRERHSVANGLGPSSEVLEIFGYWKGVMERPDSILGKSIETVIRDRLSEGFSVEQIKSAVDGCKASAFHMGEDPANGNGTVFNSLTLICKNSAKVEEFIERLKPKKSREGQNGRAWTHEDSIQNGIRLAAELEAEEKAERERNGGKI